MNYAIKNVNGQWLGKSSRHIRQSPMWVSRPYDVIFRLGDMMWSAELCNLLFNIDDYVVVMFDVDTASITDVPARDFVQDHYKPSWRGSHKIFIESWL